jgi:uncharacterized protein (DUF58 family)
MQPHPALTLTDRADLTSRALPPLLVEAQRIAATVILGVHGRKRSGPGETFWQYRPYSFGDATQRIDWHKSARSDRVYIRETEWEAANTLWLWTSSSPSMQFRSHLSGTTKSERADLIALALSSLAIRAHERVAALDAPYPPGHAKPAVLRIAQWLLDREASPNLPAPSQLRQLKRFATVALFSDFYDKPHDIAEAATAIAAQGVSGHMVQIVDPAEETLPYQGRVEFQDIGGGPLRYVAGKTENLREAYQAKFQEQREAVRSLARRLGWSFAVHRTDQSPVSLLLTLHGLIGGEKSQVAAQGAR